MRLRVASLRPTRFDELGLRRALADRMVPFLVGAMAFLAALAVAGWMGAEAQSRHWGSGAGSTLTVQVPRPTEPAAAGDKTRVEAVQALLLAAPGVLSARALSDKELNDLLTPWLGADMKSLAIPVPAVIAVHTSGDAVNLNKIADQLAAAAPGTLLEDHAAWAGRMATLARSLQLCAGLVLLIVTVVTGAVIAVATRSGLAARREAIMIVHQLGATDGYIARRFATRAAALAVIGGLIGGLLSLPVIFALAALAASPDGAPDGPRAFPPPLTLLPLPLWLLPIILPVAAALIGCLTTQVTVRRWLRHLP